LAETLPRKGGAKLERRNQSFETPGGITQRFNAAMLPGRDQPGTYILVWDRLEPKAETAAA
jgi:hypothetical protein